MIDVRLDDVVIFPRERLIRCIFSLGPGGMMIVQGWVVMIMSVSCMLPMKLAATRRNGPWLSIHCLRPFKIIHEATSSPSIGDRTGSQWSGTGPNVEVRWLGASNIQNSKIPTSPTRDVVPICRPSYVHAQIANH